MYEDMMAGGILAGMFLFILFFALLFYIVAALSIMTIANKTKTKYAWLAWIPIANFFLIANIAKQPWWIALIMLLVNIIPVLGSLVFIGLWIFLFWKICERLGKPGSLSLIMIIPLANLILLLYLAFSSDAKMKTPSRSAPTKKSNRK